VTELTFEAISSNGVATLYLGEDLSRPYTDKEIAKITDSSRYTITRGKDGVWRISDRKPSFKWFCESITDHIPLDD
jgi:hypothetical protein